MEGSEVMKLVKYIAVCALLIAPAAQAQQPTYVDQINLIYAAEQARAMRDIADAVNNLPRTQMRLEEQMREREARIQNVQERNAVCYRKVNGVCEPKDTK